MESYNFVKQYLSKHNTRIMAGGVDLFPDDETFGDEFDTDNIRTDVLVGEEIIKYHGYKAINLGRLQVMGMKVVLQKYKKKLKYHIVNRFDLARGIPKIPKDVEIILNTKDWFVRLVGKNVYGVKDYGHGPWIQIPTKHRKMKKKYKTMNVDKIVEEVKDHAAFTKNIKKYLMTGVNISKDDYFNIKEVPFGVTDENEIVCFKKSDDPQKIALIGITGGGKTVMTARLVAQFKYKFNEEIINLNDTMGQFHSWALPKGETGVGINHHQVGESGVALPIVMFYIASPDIYYFDDNTDICFKLPIPLKQFLKNREFFSRGIEKWDFKETGKYIDAHMEEFMKCKSLDEIRATYNDKISFGKRGDDAKNNLINKHMAIWKSCFDEEFLDINYPDNDFSWEVYKDEELIFKGHPIMACLEAGVVPTLQTEFAKDYLPFRNIMGHYMKKLMKYQKKKHNAEKKRIFIVIDELGTIYQKGKGIRGDDNATLSLIDLYTQGRFQKFGAFINIQSYLDLHKNITDNLSHVFLTKIASNKERNAIASDFGIEKDELNTVLNNLDNSELIVLSRKDPFVVYNINGKRKLGRHMYVIKMIMPNVKTLKSKE